MSQPDTQPPTSASPSPPADTPPRRRRGRRILIASLILLAAILLLTATAPYLLSTGPGTRLVVAIANGQLRGTIEIDDLSLGWFSPTDVRGLRLYDPQGRLVVETQAVESDLSTWDALVHPEAFGQLAVRSANITLYETPAGGFSLSDALPAPSPEDEQPEPDEPGPEPHGRILLENASVEIVRLSGHRLKLTDIQTTLDVETAGKMNGETSFALASGGQLNLRYDLDRLRETDLLKRRIEMTLATPQPINLGPIARFATGADRLAGELTVDGKVSSDAPQGQADLKLDIVGLRADLAGREANPLDITLALTGQRQAENVNATVALETSAGDARLELALSDPAAWQTISSDAFTAAALDGEPIELPPLTVNGQADINLPRIAAAIPALLTLPHNAELTNGKLTSTLRLSTRPVGIDVPAPVPLHATGSFQLVDVVLDQPPAGTRPARTIRWPATSSEFTAMLLEGTGLSVQQASLDTGFATAEAQGTIRHFEAVSEIDLAAMWQQLGTVVDLGEKQLAGRATFQTTVDAADTALIRADVASSVSGLLFASDTRDVSLRSLDLRVPLQLVRPKQDGKKQLQAVVWNEATLAVNNKATLATAGRYDAPAGDLQAQAHMDRQDLASLADLARALGADVPDDVTGQLSLNADVRVPANESQPITAAFELGVDNLALRQPQRTVTLAQARLSGTDIRYARESQAAEAQVAFNGQNVTVVTRAKDGQPDKTQTLTVPTFDGRAGVERADAASQQAFGMAFNIADLSITRGQQNIPFGKLQAEVQGAAETQRKLIRFSTLQLTSTPLTLQLTGENTIANYDTTRDLSLQGEFAGQWQRVMDLVYAVKPSLNDEDEIVVSFTGPLAPAGTQSETGTFTITGPARQPDVQPVFRGVDGGTALGWTSGSVAGIELGPAAIRPKLEAGKLTIDAEPIPASGGMLRPGGSIDFTGEQPVYRLPGEVRLVENVSLRPEIGTQLLSRINPIFGELMGLEGQMSLTVRDLDLPLGEAIKTAGRGSGSLDLSNMSVKSRSGLLDALVGMWGAASGDFQEVRIEGVDFAIEDGRVHYDNFRMIFGEDFDLLFSGSVGFDDTLDLWVSVPVHAGVLRAFKIKNSVLDVANLLQEMGVRIEIPIRGTRLSPKLDFDRQRIDKLVAEAMKKLAEKQVQDALFNLIQQGLQGGE